MIGVIIAMVIITAIVILTGAETMSRLTAAQIAKYAQDAGFEGDDLTIAVAIALAESNVPAEHPPTGNSKAYNPEQQANTPEGLGSYGLWQIYLKAHPEYKSINLYDPKLNAGVAFSIYSDAGNSFKPWSTYKNSAYLQYLPDAQNAVLEV